MHYWRWTHFAALVLIVGGGSVAADQSPGAAENVSNQSHGRLALARLSESDYPHLHNLWQLADGIYSGSEPQGDEGFGELKDLGVDVIVSVDGAEPNVASARGGGMRYVHIPIGYDGIPHEAGRALARVVREARAAGETVYFHCHHGKHRGPAGAAVACIAAGVATNDSALEILARAGTSQDYAGLWRDVRAYRSPGPDEVLPELVEVARVDSLVAAMAVLDRGFDHLKLCDAAGWKPPTDHPDIVPTQEALVVKEALREAARNLAGDHDDRFAEWLGSAEEIAAQLEQALRGNNTTVASDTFQNLGKACQQCHTEYRN